jgi:APA family basic amino acid/polyamine antiporter
MPSPSTPSLKRTLSLPLLVLYGLGTTIGAGIYALVGELAGVAGYLAPVSFLVASVMAGLTALSFAEMSSRYPQCAGAALYVKEGFASEWLSTVVGLLVVTAGLVSAAALTNGFVGYLHQFIDVDRIVVILVVTCLLGVIAAWGITQSVTIAAAVTLIEIGGLILVIAVSHSSLVELPDRWPELIPDLNSASIGSIFTGSLLAFYAFIGFEDMVDVAEETRDVKRTLPLAIIITLSITALLYMLIMVIAVLSVPPQQLATSEAALAFLYERFTGGESTVISVIGLFAIINGALIQMIMASRVLYGLSSRGQLPEFLRVVHPETRTPIFATAIVTAIVVALALVGRLATLAEMTSVIMLVIFTVVNLALWRVKQRDPRPDDAVVFPAWVPLAGFVVSATFVLSRLMQYVL